MKHYLKEQGCPCGKAHTAPIDEIVVGKGVIKAIKKAYPQANIVAVDYDPGASEVNQLNRIKLMLSAAKKNMEQNGEV